LVEGNIHKPCKSHDDPQALQPSDSDRWQRMRVAVAEMLWKHPWGNKWKSLKYDGN
jgi:hypothetical protein